MKKLKKMAKIEKLILIMNLIIKIAKLNGRNSSSDDYYDAPPGLDNYDDDVILAITKKYNKLVRPISSLDLKLRLSLRQIISVEEKTQIITSSFNLITQWKDGRLKWDITNSTFGGLTQIVIPATSIWTPDLFVINTANSNGFISITSSNLAVVDYQGYVYLIIGVTNLQTRCRMNMYYFPFDKQNCSIIIGSWQHDTGRITFESDTSKIDLSNYIPHPVWTLKSVTVGSVFGSDRFFGLSDLQNEDISFNLLITRGSSYYVINLLACFILNVVALFAFFAPFAQQVAICMTAFLTFSVQSLNINNFLPVQSLYVPVISVYFICSIFITFATFSWFWTLNYYSSKPFPFFFHSIGSFSKKILFWIYPKPKVNSQAKDQNRSNENQQAKLDIDNHLPPKNPPKENCIICEDNKIKEDKKKKEKETNESVLQAINYLVFYLIIIFIFLVMFIIWVVNAANQS